MEGTGLCADLWGIKSGVEKDFRQPSWLPWPLWSFREDTGTVSHQEAGERSTGLRDVEGKATKATRQEGGWRLAESGLTPLPGTWPALP